MKLLTLLALIPTIGFLILIETPILADEKQSHESGQAHGSQGLGLGRGLVLPPLDQPDLDHRVAQIIKGQQASDGQFPWMAMLMRDGGGEVFCSGSLVDSSWVLTAGHCLSIANIGDDVYIATGNDGELRNIIGTVSHGSADIGLLELDQPQLTDTISLGSTAVPASAVIIGFGQDEALNRGTLSFASANVVEDNACAGIESTDDRLCVTDSTSGICFGDSGGPLIDGVSEAARLIGVAAEIDHTIGCGVSPTGLRIGSFTRISDYAGWIDEQTNRATPSVAPPDPINQ